LLSERTLNALLVLGAFLILASAFVISTLNPTGLAPLPHLGVMAATTAVFYTAGYAVRRRLGLTGAGAALLAVAAGLIPLDIWTLGGHGLFQWDGVTVWLAASTVCLPVYLVSHYALRDRVFALLVAVAGCSETLALTHWLGLPSEWSLAALLPLAIGYVLLARALMTAGPGRSRWRLLARVLFVTAQVIAPAVLSLLLLASLSSATVDVEAPRLFAGTLSHYAVGTAWWLGVALYALCAHLGYGRRYRYLTAWLLPVAFLLTLTKAPLSGAWYDFPLALLAAGYLAYGQLAQRWGGADDPRGLLVILRDPVYGTGAALTALAACWPLAQPRSALATLLVLAAIYGAATILLAQRACAYIAVSLLPMAYALALHLLGISGDAQPLAWTVLAAALLAAAEALVRRGGEAWRPLRETTLSWEVVFHRGAWRSRFAAPLFTAGYAVAVGAAGGAMGAFAWAPLLAGVPVPATVVTLGLSLLVALCLGSTVARRSGAFLYPATWLALLPLTSVCGLVAHHSGATLTAASLAQVGAVVGVVYLALAYALDRRRDGGRYAAPLYLSGYALLTLTALATTDDQAAEVRVLGLGLLALAWSAWSVSRDWHRSYLRLARRLVPAGPAAAREVELLRTLFLWPACALFPLWLILALGLAWPSLDVDVAAYGLTLALLAPLYGALGRYRARGAASLPWETTGVALSVLGPLLAVLDPVLRPVTLGVTLAFYVATAVVTRRARWLWWVAALAPLLLIESLWALALPWRLAGPALVALGLVDGLITVVLSRSRPARPWLPQGDGRVRGGWTPLSLPGLLAPLPSSWWASPHARYARPFCLAGYAVNALGLALVIPAGSAVVAVCCVLAATHYAASGVYTRRGLWSVPTALALAGAYVAALVLVALPDRYVGLGLLPGIVAALAIAEALRRRLDTRATSRHAVSLSSFPSGLSWPLPSCLSSGVGLPWSLPWYAVSCVGTVAVVAVSPPLAGAQALAWGSVATVYGLCVALWRHPGPLYAVLGAALAAYLCTVHALAPIVSLSWIAAGLAAPAWLLWDVAHVVWRGRVSHDNLTATPILTDRWASPLVQWGALALGGALLGSARDAAAGLTVALTAGALLIACSIAWHSAGARWAGLIVAGMAVQETLRQVGVPMIAQPPYWAAVGLGVSALLPLLTGLSERYRRGSRTRMEESWGSWRSWSAWHDALSLSSGAASVLALLVSAAYEVAWPGRAGLDDLAATAALAGLALVAQALDRRERLLAYAGVALLEVGYALDLWLLGVAQLQAYALPAGVYLLVVAYLEWRRGSGKGVKVTLEVTGLALLLGTALLQATGFLGAGPARYGYDAFLLVESLAIFGLGALLRWQRTFYAGAVAAVVDALVLLADPVRAINTWYLLGAAGLTMMGLVIFIEQRRRQIPRWIEAWRAYLEAWD